LELSGRVALVTGGAVRLGRAISEALAGEEMKLVVHYHASSSAADQLCADIRARGGKAVSIGADLADPEQVTRLAREAAAAFGGIDLLVNNAVHFLNPKARVSPGHSTNLKIFKQDD
jgi:NAD(P)-dependent dehydrogenase (short-subunit alcohol dehydrogenase family)